MTELMLNYLVDENTPVYQHPDYFHFNTDTRLLAEFVTVKDKDTILDIGTNNAALLVYFDKFNVKKLIGVEILEEPFKIAEINAKSFIKHEYELINQPIQKVACDKVDLIVSNPPYFKEKDTHPNTKLTLRQMGRIEKNLTLEELVYCASNLLKENGRFCFVHRPNRLNDIYTELLNNNFRISRMQVAYDKQTQVEKTICIEAIKQVNCQCKILPPKFI